jgi:hypothetical protein
MTGAAAALNYSQQPPADRRTRLLVTTPAPRDAWREVLVADRYALAFQTPEWTDAICATGRYEDASRLYETSCGARMILPLARRRGTLLRTLAPQGSMPHAWGMGGMVADAPIEAAQLSLIAADLASLPALRTSIRPNPLQADLWADATDALNVTSLPRRAHVLDLQGGADEVWQRKFASSARRAVRKAERSGLHIQCGYSDELLAEFHELLGCSVKRWAHAQHEPLALARLRARVRDPLAKFTCVARAMGASLRVWVAYRDAIAVASIIVLLGADASYTRGAMDKELAGPVAANELLHWLAIRDACAAGCRQYHMGESGASVSLARFKEKLGARPVGYAEYRFERVALTAADAAARGLVKRALRFRDA